MPLNKDQQKQFDTICARIAGGESLRTICLSKDLPTPQGVRKWLNADEGGELVARYARAREEQADHYADEIISIADNEDLAPEDRRIMVDARKWVASKLKPRKYGDKLALGGADDLPAINAGVQERADAFTDRLAGMIRRADAGKDTTH